MKKHAGVLLGVLRGVHFELIEHAAFRHVARLLVVVDHVLALRALAEHVCERDAAFGRGAARRMRSARRRVVVQIRLVAAAELVFEDRRVVVLLELPRKQLVGVRRPRLVVVEPKD